jgi:hypothetical protein
MEVGLLILIPVEMEDQEGALEVIITQMALAVQVLQAKVLQAVLHLKGAVKLLVRAVVVVAQVAQVVQALEIAQVE